jgi:uncharacterized iron-regulated protein
VSARWGRLGAALLLAGCAGPVRLAPDGDPLAQGREVAARGREAEVIYLGEQHDNPAHHAHQRQILEALLEAGARPALAFEMLEEGQQEAVERAVAAGLGRDAFAERLRWKTRGWPDFGMYWPLFDLAERHRLAVVAVDLDSDLVRRISRGGLAAVGSARADLASLLPPDAGRERRIARSIKEGHCSLLPESRLPAMVEAWHARNVTMARRIVQALARHRPVVVIVGAGHQEPGGLPAQLEALRPGTRQLIVEMVESVGGKEIGEASPLADIVWRTPTVDRRDPCAPLRGTAQPRR